MMSLNPLLLVGGVIGTVSVLLLIAYVCVKDKKTSMGFERSMADGEHCLHAGACLCGQVRVRVTEAPVVAAACHCRACQKLTGGAYSLSLMLPASGLSVEGETEIGGLHGAAQHHFCRFCKTWVYSRMAALGPFVNLRAPILDEGGAIDA